MKSLKSSEVLVLSSCSSSQLRWRSQPLGIEEMRSLPTELCLAWLTVRSPLARSKTNWRNLLAGTGAQWFPQEQLMEKRKAFRLFCVSNSYSIPIHCEAKKSKWWTVIFIIGLPCLHFSTSPLSLTHVWLFCHCLAPCMALCFTSTFRIIMYKMTACLFNIPQFKRNAVSGPNYHHSLHTSVFLSPLLTY